MVSTLLLELVEPLVLDLNSLAKGLAIDLAARELGELRNFCIEAGGDLFGRGRGPRGGAWRVGIRDPHGDGLLARSLTVTDAAVCTSGDYERGGHNTAVLVTAEGEVVECP